MSCGDLTEIEWLILRVLLPVEREPGKRGRGRPPEDNRNVINGILCLGDARGRPIAFHLTPGEAADCKAYDTLIDLPEQAPDALLADKAYDTDAIRADLKERGIKPVIPPKSNRTATIRYSKCLYRQRNCIERVLGHLKINRAIATRYDQLAESFLGMLFIASARYWIKFVHAA